MSDKEILEKAIRKNCLECGNAIQKSPKQSYIQWERQKYCSHVCSAIGPNKSASTAKDRSNLHKFWRRRIPEPTVCELCREPRKLALSNRSQEYHNVITDWWYLCYQCHGRYDAIGIRVWDFRKKQYGQRGRAS